MSFWSVVFLYSMQKQTISLLDCDVQQKVHFIWQTLVMASSVDGRGRRSKAFLNAKLTPKKKKKRLWSLFGGLLPIRSTTAFWILVKPLHLRSMFSKLMRCTENCNAYSWHWSTERTQFSTTMPDRMSCNQSFKRWINCATRFCLIYHIYLTSRQWTATFSSI